MSKRADKFLANKNHENFSESISIDESGDSTEYFVEKIIGKKVKGKSVQYLVKWLGYDDDDDLTWEPLSHLIDCQEYIDEYEAQISNKKIVKDDSIKPSNVISTDILSNQKQSFGKNIEDKNVQSTCNYIVQPTGANVTNIKNIEIEGKVNLNQNINEKCFNPLLNNNLLSKAYLHEISEKTINNIHLLQEKKTPENMGTKGNENPNNLSQSINLFKISDEPKPPNLLDKNTDYLNNKQNVSLEMLDNNIDNPDDKLAIFLSQKSKINSVEKKAGPQIKNQKNETESSINDLLKLDIVKEGDGKQLKQMNNIKKYNNTISLPMVFPIKPQLSQNLTSFSLNNSFQSSSNLNNANSTSVKPQALANSINSSNKINENNIKNPLTIAQITDTQTKNQVIFAQNADSQANNILEFSQGTDTKSKHPLEFTQNIENKSKNSLSLMQPPDVKNKITSAPTQNINGKVINSLVSLQGAEGKSKNLLVPAQSNESKSNHPLVTDQSNDTKIKKLFASSQNNDTNVNNLRVSSNTTDAKMNNPSVFAHNINPKSTDLLLALQNDDESKSNSLLALIKNNDSKSKNTLMHAQNNENKVINSLEIIQVNESKSKNQPPPIQNTDKRVINSLVITQNNDNKNKNPSGIVSNSDIKVNNSLAIAQNNDDKNKEIPILGQNIETKTKINPFLIEKNLPSNFSNKMQISQTESFNTQKNEIKNNIASFLQEYKFQSGSSNSVYDSKQKIIIRENKKIVNTKSDIFDENTPIKKIKMNDSSSKNISKYPKEQKNNETENNINKQTEKLDKTQEIIISKSLSQSTSLNLENSMSKTEDSTKILNEKKNFVQSKEKSKNNLSIIFDKKSDSTYDNIVNHEYDNPNVFQYILQRKGMSFIEKMELLFPNGNPHDDVPREIKEIKWNGPKPSNPLECYFKVIWKPRKNLLQKAPSWIQGYYLVKDFSEPMLQFFWDKCYQCRYIS